VGVPVGLAALLVARLLNETVLYETRGRGMAADILAAPALAGVFFGIAVTALRLAGARHVTARGLQTPDH
jgi:hypothetical protein